MKRYKMLVVIFLATILCSSLSFAQGNELRVAVSRVVSHLNPYGYPSAHGDRLIRDLVWEPLFRIGPDYTLEPVLAESWEWTDNGELIIFLRKGIKFHDQSVFDADDVIASVEASKGELSKVSKISRQLGALRKKGDHQIEVTPNKNAGDMAITPLLNIPIIPSEFVPIKRHREIPGTGPFAINYYVPASYVELVRRDYWDNDQKLSKSVDAIKIMIAPELRVRIGLLANSEVDMLIEPLEWSNLLFPRRERRAFILSGDKLLSNRELLLNIAPQINSLDYKGGFVGVSRDIEGVAFDGFGIDLRFVEIRR